jgi:hypothetical protein
MFGKSHEGAVKFDYFICTVSGALFAYIGQTYTPHRVDFSSSILEPLSLVFLALSFFLGLKRIEAFNISSKVNYAILEASETAGQIADQLLSEEGESFHNPQTGEVLGRIAMDNLRVARLEEARRMKAKLLLLDKKAFHFYNWRDRFLLLGFLAIFLSKVLQPYQTDRPSQKATPTTQTPPASANQTKASP